MNDQQEKEQSSGVLDQEIRAALDRHWAASILEAAILIRASDLSQEAVLEYPQSGRRTRGRRNTQRSGRPSKKRFSVVESLAAALFGSPNSS